VCDRRAGHVQACVGDEQPLADADVARIANAVRSSDGLDGCPVAHGDAEQRLVALHYMDGCAAH